MYNSYIYVYCLINNYMDTIKYNESQANENLNLDSKKDKYRIYTENNIIHSTYKKNHTYQTVNFVKAQLNKHCVNFDKTKMKIWDALEKLDEITDDSDPDIEQSQLIHALQTAEGLKTRYPELDWLHLIGLIHDLGKIMALPEYGMEPQWCVVGDTFPVGCAFSNKIVYHHCFENNLDNSDPRYNTKFGIYQPNCGLDNLLFSFGHDEYFYQVCKHNTCLIPEVGLKIIRYHSFYAWHSKAEYQYLMSQSDAEILKWIKIFNEHDLYTKDNFNFPDINNLKNYYQELIDKYFPNALLEW